MAFDELLADRVRTCLQQAARVSEKKMFGGLIYDLPCPRGHHTLIAEPQIARAMRKTKGSRATLKEASH